MSRAAGIPSHWQAYGHMVTMGQSRRFSTSERAFTFGIGGCAVTLAIRGAEVQLAHFPPAVWSMHAAGVEGFRADVVHVWTPGEWQKVGGKWEMVAVDSPLLQRIQHAIVHPYSMNIMAGEPPESRMVRYVPGRIDAFDQGIAL